MNTLKKIDYLPHLESCWQEHLEPRAEDVPTVISTFAGCGGSSLGYSMAGFRELLAIEWDDNAVETFKLNFPDVPVYHGDIAKISVKEVLEMTGLEVGELDIFDGSPPCQGFSTAGKRQLEDSRNGLYLEFSRLLRGLQPKIFVMENVSGMIKGKMKIVFAEILRDLKSCGYRVSVRLLNAMYFGVPQSRQRLIFIGVRDDLSIEPSHPRAETKTISAECATANINNKTYNRPLADVGGKIWDHIKQGQNGTFYRKNYYMNSIKLDPKKPFPTIPKIVSGTGGHMHWIEKRTMTIEEIKRGGSFPDGFLMIGKFNEQYMRIGNSVPPLFMRSIAKHIRSEILERMATAFPELVIERIGTGSLQGESGG